MNTQDLTVNFVDVDELEARVLIHLLKSIDGRMYHSLTFLCRGIGEAVGGSIDSTCIRSICLCVQFIGSILANQAVFHCLADELLDYSTKGAV